MKKKSKTKRTIVPTENPATKRGLKTEKKKEHPGFGFYGMKGTSKFF